MLDDRLCSLQLYSKQHFSMDVFHVFLNCAYGARSAQCNSSTQNFPATPTGAGNYLLKVHNSNIRTRCEIYSELTIKTPKRRHCPCSGAFIVNFENIS